MMLVLPPVPCPACGVSAPPVLLPGTGPHAAKAVCPGCGHFLKWVGRADLTRLTPPPEVGMNVCSLVGVLARDPIVKFEPKSGHQVCSFTLSIVEPSYG